MCEMCGKRKAVRWYVVDDNAEVELCAKCAKELRDSGEMGNVKPIV